MKSMSSRLPLRIDPDKLKLSPLQLAPAAFQSPLPVQNCHLIFEDEAIGLAVGVWDTSTMQEAFGPYPGDEFITVLDGAFSILDAAGAAVTGTAGQSAIFRIAIPVSWKQGGYLRKVFLTLREPCGTTPQIASARVDSPETIGPERPLPTNLVPKPVLSPSRITLDNNEKIRP